MQILSSQAGTTDTIRDIPARLLTALAEGKRVEATVIAQLKSDLVQIKLGDTVLSLKTDIPLQAGQQISLERNPQTGETILKVLPTANDVTDKLLSNLPPLRQGQTVAVEVIKLLADKNLLVKPVQDHFSASISNAIAKPLLNKLPEQIEIDVSALRQNFKLGDRLAMEVLRERPLAVGLRENVVNREQLIAHYQRTLLPQIEQVKPNLIRLNTLLPQLTNNAEIKPVVTQLLQHVTEKTALQQPMVLHQTLLKSGLFMESGIRHSDSQAVPVPHDFKANLLKLSDTVRQQIQVMTKPDSQQTDKLYQSLPTDIRQALQQIVTSPQAMQRLPAQIQSFLASQGQTPANLLLSLLSSMRPTLGAEATSITPALQSVSTPLASMSNQVMQQSQTGVATNSRIANIQMLRDVLREVETVASRIQFNQLAILKEADSTSNTNVWLFDVPVKERQQLELMQLRLEQRKRSGNKQDEDIWQVQLNLETVNLGPMQAQISLYQNDAKVVVLAERPESAELLSAHSELLEQRLVELGVSVSLLSCRQAPVHELKLEPVTVKASDSWVDISV